MKTFFWKMKNKIVYIFYMAEKELKKRKGITFKKKGIQVDRSLEIHTTLFSNIDIFSKLEERTKIMKNKIRN